MNFIFQPNLLYSWRIIICSLPNCHQFWHICLLFVPTQALWSSNLSVSSALCNMWWHPYLPRCLVSQAHADQSKWWDKHQGSFLGNAGKTRLKISQEEASCGPYIPPKFSSEVVFLPISNLVFDTYAVK